MKEPKTYGELLELVNPNDLLHVLGFSGVNDRKETTHYDVKRKFENFVYTSFNGTRRIPTSRNVKLSRDHYETIVKCIQDYYKWSRGFNHEESNIYKRVVNALEIPMEEIEKIYEILEKYKNEKT